MEKSILEELEEEGYKSHIGEIGYNDGTQHKLYCDGFKDGFNVGMNTVLDKFKEMRLKEVESQFLNMIDCLSSWKTESKEKTE